MSTRDAIIAAGARLFSEKGYEGMTMKQIADAVGVTPPAVYAFFKNKEDLFGQIVKEIISSHFDVAAYHTEMLRDKPVKDQLYGLIRALFEFQMREKLHTKIFTRLLLFPPKVFRINLKEELNILAEREWELLIGIFEKGMRSGELRPGDASGYARAMLTLMDGLFWQMQRCEESVFWNSFELSWRQFWQGIEPLAEENRR